VSGKGRKLEPPFHLDMPFDEPLQRYAQTKPAEIEPPPGKKRKAVKAAKRLASLGKTKQEKPNPKRKSA
jgi:hypothetical protein